MSGEYPKQSDEMREREKEVVKAFRDAMETICPTCGYYCTGKGGFGCIDKPSLKEPK